MNRYIIGSLWDRVNRNGANKNFEYLFEGSKRVDELNKRADSILDNSNSTLNEAKKTNDMNKNVQQQINTLIAESGTSDAELLQVRTDIFGKTFAVAKDRLDQSQKRLHHIDENKNKEIMPKIKERKPMLTFVDDDGNVEVLNKWEPILQSKGNKLTVALVTSWVENKQPTVMGWDDIHRLKETYGVEFVSHTHEHGHGSSQTSAQLHNEFSKAKKILEREGLVHDIIVQPYGENVENVRKISRQYARANVATVEGINYPPLSTYRLYRISLGEDTNNTWTHYKSVLDEAIANNGWVIFKSHSQYPSFNATQIQLIRDIIDYAKSNGIENVSLSEGLDRVGNIIDVGDYVNRQADVEYTVMDYQGVIHSHTNSKDFWELKFNSVSVNTLLSGFPEKSKSMCSILSTNANGFPENRPGLLETVRSQSDSTQFQMYYIYNSENVYKRRWNTSTSSWTPFVLVMSDKKEIKFRTWASQVVLEAKTSVDMVISNTLTNDVKLTDSIHASPDVYLAPGIMYNVMIKADKEVVIRYFNTTNASVTIPATWYNFEVVKNS